MRTLVVLLLLANVGFFAWSHWVAPRRALPPEPAPLGRQIVLASEAPAPEPLPTLPAGGTASCYSLGPFLDLTAAARASTGLRQAGLAPRQRATEGAVWAGYWVSLSGIASADDAARIVDKLRQGGIGDAYVMPAENEGPVVSLGLFTEKSRALRRSDEVKALGFRPTVTERQREGMVYWIDVNVDSPKQLPDPASFGDNGRIFRLQIKPCDVTGQGSQPVPPAGVPDSGVPG